MSGYEGGNTWGFYTNKKQVSQSQSDPTLPDCQLLQVKVLLDLVWTIYNLHLSPYLRRCCPLDRVLAAMYGVNRVLGVAVYQHQDEVVMLSPLCLVPGKSYFVCPVSVAVTWNKSEAFCQKSEEVLLLSCPQPSTRHHVQDNHQRPWPLYYSTPLFFWGDSSNRQKIGHQGHF